MAFEGYRNPLGACSVGLQSVEVSRILLERTRDLAHQFHDIAFRIAESHHPQIVGWHRGDPTRRRHNLHTPLEEKLMRGVDIRDILPSLKGGASQAKHGITSPTLALEGTVRARSRIT